MVSALDVTIRKRDIILIFFAVYSFTIYFAYITIINLNYKLQIYTDQLEQVLMTKFIDKKVTFKTLNKTDEFNATTFFDYSYEFLTNCDTKCDSNIYLDVVFLINTFIDNLDRRNAIRQTWGNESIEDINMRHVFLMGVYPKNDSVRQETLKENEIYGDIVLADFEDTYKNNSIKCMMGIDWARKYCNNSKFYIISDDDSYYSIVHLMKYLKTCIEQHVTYKYPAVYNQDAIQKMRFFGGHLFIDSVPQRSGKFAITEEEFPYRKYLPFVNGHAMIMSRDTLDEFYEAAKYTKLIWLDDVYFGYLAAWAKINIENIPAITYEHLGSAIDHYDNMISTHYVPNATELIRIWNGQEKRRKALAQLYNMFPLRPRP